MCHWMGLHIHDWIDNYGVAFLYKLLEWGCTFSRFWWLENSGMKGLKIERFTPCYVKQKCGSSFQDVLVKRFYKVDAY